MLYDGSRVDLVASFNAPVQTNNIIWIDLASDPNGSVLKSFDGHDWIDIDDSVTNPVNDEVKQAILNAVDTAIGAGVDAKISTAVNALYNDITNDLTDAFTTADQAMQATITADYTAADAAVSQAFAAADDALLTSATTTAADLDATLKLELETILADADEVNLQAAKDYVDDQTAAMMGDIEDKIDDLTATITDVDYQGVAFGQGYTLKSYIDEKAENTYDLAYGAAQSYTDTSCDNVVSSITVTMDSRFSDAEADYEQKIATGVSDANAYTDAKLATDLAQQYADIIADTDDKLATLSDTVTDDIADTLAAAKTYTDALVASVDVGGELSGLRDLINDDIDTAKADAINTANAYTDTALSNIDISAQLSDLETSLTSDIADAVSTSLDEAKAYADAAAAAVDISADLAALHDEVDEELRTLTDESLAAAKEYADTQDADILTAAKTYADGKAADAILAAGAEAVTIADAAVSSEATLRSTADSAEATARAAADSAEQTARIAADDLLNYNITSATSRITTIEGELPDITSSLSSLTTKVSTVEGSISDAMNDIATNATDITGIKSSITSIETAAAITDNTLSSTRDDVDELAGYVATAQGDITSLQTMIAGYGDNITALQSNKADKSYVVGIKSDLESFTYSFGQWKNQITWRSTNYPYIEAKRIYGTFEYNTGNYLDIDARAIYGTIWGGTDRFWLHAEHLLGTILPKNAPRLNDLAGTIHGTYKVMAESLFGTVYSNDKLWLSADKILGTILPRNLPLLQEMQGTIQSDNQVRGRALFDVAGTRGYTPTDFLLNGDNLYGTIGAYVNGTGTWEAGRWSAHKININAAVLYGTMNPYVYIPNVGYAGSDDPNGDRGISDTKMFVRSTFKDINSYNLDIPAGQSGTMVIPKQELVELMGGPIGRVYIIGPTAFSEINNGTPRPFTQQTMLAYLDAHVSDNPSKCVYSLCKIANYNTENPFDSQVSTSSDYGPLFSWHSDTRAFYPQQWGLIGVPLVGNFNGAVVNAATVDNIAPSQLGSELYSLYKYTRRAYGLDAITADLPLGPPISVNDMSYNNAAFIRPGYKIRYNSEWTAQGAILDKGDVVPIGYIAVVLRRLLANVPNVDWGSVNSELASWAY